MYVITLTGEFAVDPEICLRWEKPGAPYFLPVADLFQLKHIRLKCSRLCAFYTVISVVLYVVRAAYKFDFRLATNETNMK